MVFSMFGLLKKKLNDIVKKFSKEEEKELKEREEALPPTEEMPHVEEKITEKTELPETVKTREEPSLGERKEETISKTEEVEFLPNDREEKIIIEEKMAEETAEVKEVAEKVQEQKEESTLKKEKETIKKEKRGLLTRIFGIKEGAAEEKPVVVEKSPKDILPVLAREETKKEIITQEKKKIGIVGRVIEKQISKDEADKFCEELKMALLESDVALVVAEKICKLLQNEITGKTVKRGETEKIVKESLEKSIKEVLNQERIDIESVIDKAKSENRPALIIFLGFNGTGKTTNLAKLANLLIKNGHKVVLAAGDTFRAASIEQLETHSRNLGAEVIKQKYGSDSAAVIFDAREHAKANGYDVVLADTAGRSHSNVNLMDELKKVVRVNRPDLKILVLDALTGNDIVEQAKSFDEAVGVDGIILAKADVYEKGGAALSAAYTIRKPIVFLGVGQGYDDLKSFDEDEIVNNLIGS